MGYTDVATIYVDDDDNYTCTAGAAIIGARFVVPMPGGVGNKPLMQLATAGGRATGVSGVDAATGADFAKYSEGVIGVLCSGALTAGTPVQVGANGVAVAWTTGICYGVANAAAADATICPIELQGM